MRGRVRQLLAARYTGGKDGGGEGGRDRWRGVREREEERGRDGEVLGRDGEVLGRGRDGEVLGRGNRFDRTDLPFILSLSVLTACKASSYFFCSDSFSLCFASSNWCRKINHTSESHQITLTNHHKGGKLVQPT